MLAAAGAAVGVADLSADAGARVAADLRASGVRATEVTMDVADVVSVEAGWKSVNSELGRPSILVNAAATWVIKPFADTTAEEAERVVGVTLMGTMNVIRVALPDLTSKGGSIVTIISDGARIGERYMSVYSAAKAGLLGLTKSVAREVGRSGVRVNGVAPGTTETPGAAGFIEQAGGAEKLAKAYPLGRIGQPEDIAGAVLFLVSPLSSWMTGQILSVSGGFTML
jgi:NAD(P)-dependent dehydrogenase (short-subunit alcohol dehydrogenase family)